MTTKLTKQQHLSDQLALEAMTARLRKEAHDERHAQESRSRLVHDNHITWRG